jgi:uncharacterized protein YceH (UPF0502 family)
MTPLTPDEARVLGVLIEKSTTTPDQYPLSLNAAVAGANQKNNRDPVTSLSDDAVWDALEGLRSKGLVVRIESGAGSRVHRFRHNATDVLRGRAGELAVLAELLLRGPQTQGELRGRASRMHPMDTLDVVRDMLRALSDREEPLVRQIPPSPGSRAERYMQLLAPDLHDVGDTSAAGSMAQSSASESAPAPQRHAAPVGPSSDGLADRVTALEAEVGQLRDALRKFAASLGESDPLS